MKKQTTLTGFTKRDLGVKSLNKCTKVETSKVGVFETTLDNIDGDTFFTFIFTDEPKTDNIVWQKVEYDRSEKAYCVGNYSGTRDKYVRGNKKVYINFTF